MSQRMVLDDKLCRDRSLETQAKWGRRIQLLIGKLPNGVGGFLAVSSKQL
jgi:hypothetical protein